MTTIESQCLETFPKWLRTLPQDAGVLGKAVESEELSEDTKRYAAGGLNYLFKSLDLIPDGIEDLGYLDDAFVIRVAASLALSESPATAQQAPELARLAAETELITMLLGADYPRLQAYVRCLKTSTVRGRSVDEILGDPSVRRDFLNEVGGWAKSYDEPSFTHDEKNIVKLRSFLTAKLPPADAEA